MKSFFVLAALLLSFGAQAQDSFDFNQGGFGPGGRFGHDDRGPWRGDDGFGRGPRGPGRDWDDRGPGRPGRPDWGRPGRGDDQIIACASNDRRPTRCRVEGFVRDVRLIRQLSRAACVEGRTFGFDRDSIWVADGCRGEFLVQTDRFGRPGRPGFPGRPGRDEPRSESVRCKSSDYRYASCGVRGRIEAVRIERQHSNAACIEGRSFGFDRDFIWVDQGCEATFRVYLR